MGAAFILPWEAVYGLRPDIQRCKFLANDWLNVYSYTSDSTGSSLYAFFLKLWRSFTCAQYVNSGGRLTTWEQILHYLCASCLSRVYRSATQLIFSSQWVKKNHMQTRNTLRVASVARGRFVPNCGRICGIHYTEGVEVNIWKGFRKKSIVSSLI
jgi:hypothetical protein